jgi:hypothetical protein
MELLRRKTPSMPPLPWLARVPWLLILLGPLVAHVALAQAPSPVPAVAPTPQPAAEPAHPATVAERWVPNSTKILPPEDQDQAVGPQASQPTPNAPANPTVPVRAYGILWAGVFATQPVQSFGPPTTVAPTSAVNPAIFAHPHEGLLSFQVQQTRAGIVVGEGTPFKGTLEIDFVHFDQSSPLAQAYPRIRVALLEWKVTETQKLFMGQTWDIFGNASAPQLLSHSFNLVGTLFLAGNIGFQRQQVGWAGNFGNFELAAAVGLQGANTGPIYNNIELSAVPTGSARIMYHVPGSPSVFGISGIGTSLRFSDGPDAQRRGAGGGQLFADLTFGGLNLHSELYAAQNLANTGALNLGQGRFGQDVQDVGGYISCKYTLGRHAFTAMYGAAAVLRPSDVVPGYTPAARTADGTLVAPVPHTAAGPGIVRNMSAHVAYWWSPVKGLSIVLEPYVYATRYKLAPSDVGRVDAENVAWGGSFGSMFQF